MDESSNSSTLGGEVLPSSLSSGSLNTGFLIVPVTLHVNGQEYSLNIDPRMTLLDTLREEICLTGTKKGCGHGQCGACTVHVNGERIVSCLTFAVMQQRKEITTIEGLANDDMLHPMQEAFIEHDAFQCGYCTAGQIMSAVALLAEVDGRAPSHVTHDVAATEIKLTDEEIRERMSGNICRCGAYNGIIAAIEDVRDQQMATQERMVEQ